MSAVALCATLTACADSETTKRKYFDSAEKYFQEQKYDEAIVEYRNALKYDTQYAEARFRLAEAYIAKNDYRNAYPEYIRAADLRPDDLRIQTRAGTMLLLGRRFEEARNRARRILQKDPTHLEGLILLGNALAGLGDLPNATQIAERAIAADPNREGTRVNLGALQLAQGKHKEAEDAFVTAVRLNPKSVSAHLALANFYQAVGRLAEAEDALKRAIAAAPDDIRTNRAVAAFYIVTGKPDAAEQYLRNIAEKTNNNGAWSDLADFYAERRRSDDAVRILEKIAADDPKLHDSAKRRIAVILHGAGRKAEAHAILVDLLKANPSNSDTLTARARLLFEDRRSDEALDVAKLAAQTGQRSAAAQLILGRVLIARGEMEQGRRALTEAVNLDPHLLEASITLAGLHLANREVDPALEVATAASQAHPDSIEPGILIVRALLLRPEDHPKARAQADALVKNFPRSAAARSTLASYFVTVGDTVSARREFERALQLDPSFTTALAELVSMDVAAGSTAVAKRRIDGYLKTRPDDPRALVLRAKVALAERQLVEAERTLRKVVSRPNAPPEAYTLLGRLFIAERRLPEATKEFTELLRNDSQSATTHLMLGLLLHAQRDVKGAIEHYEKALEIDERTAAPAANNLAWLYAENGENLERALQLAQTARTHLSGDPEPLDTLGWVYLKKGMPSLAETYIRQAIDLNPKNPTYHYHLGVLYSQKGDDANARKSLETALSLQPGQQIAQDAKKILSTLVY